MTGYVVAIVAIILAARNWTVVFDVQGENKGLKEAQKRYIEEVDGLVEMNHELRGELHIAQEEIERLRPKRNARGVFVSRHEEL